MAIGDDALAAGMQVVPGTTLAKDIDTEINRTRDYIAQNAGTVRPIAKGGTGGSTAATARAALGVVARGGGNVIELYWKGPGELRLGVRVDGIEVGTLAWTTD